MQKCYLCNYEFTDDEKEDFKCSGCGEYICADHFGNPWGSHEPEAHDEED